VIAGVIGEKKFAYDIWGDAVNTASRLESSGATGEINISQSVFNQVKNFFICEYRGKIPAKNKGDVDMYFFEAANSRILI
jgi:adenylate cyclase